MAKGKTNTKERGGRSGLERDAIAAAERGDLTVAQDRDEFEPAREGESEEESSAEESLPLDHRSAAKRANRTTRVGGLAIYKPGQGYYTRVGTAVFAGVILACLGNFLYSELEVYHDPDKAWTFYMQIGIPTLVLAGLGGLMYWIVGVNRRCCDFMILTEGEIKKVSWSTRKEVIGSTKVVIFTVITMGTLLFLVDVVFAWFFHLIGVLQLAPGVFGKMMSDAL